MTRGDIFFVEQNFNTQDFVKYIMNYLHINSVNCQCYQQNNSFVIETQSTGSAVNKLAKNITGKKFRMDISQIDNQLAIKVDGSKNLVNSIFVAINRYLEGQSISLPETVQSSQSPQVPPLCGSCGAQRKQGMNFCIQCGEGAGRELNE